MVEPRDFATVFVLQIQPWLYHLKRPMFYL